MRARNMRRVIFDHSAGVEMTVAEAMREGELLLPAGPSAVGDLEWRRALAECRQPVLAADRAVPYAPAYAFEVRRDGVPVFESRDAQTALIEATRVSGGKVVVEIHLVVPREEGQITSQETLL